MTYDCDNCGKSFTLSSPVILGGKEGDRVSHCPFCGSEAVGKLKTLPPKEESKPDPVGDAAKRGYETLYEDAKLYKREGKE